jgi:Protein of unknown function (DUF3575)
MKIQYLLTLCLLFTVNGRVHAQDALDATAQYPRANIVKLNTLPLLVGSVNVSYERRITSYFSGAVTAMAYPKRLAFSEKDTTSAYALTADFKFYVKGESLKGFYVAPYLKYRLRRNNAKEGTSPGGAPFFFYRPDREEERWKSYGAGATVGFQKIFPNAFTLDTFLGYGKYFHQELTNETNYTKQQMEYRKPLQHDFRLGLLVGYAF